MLFRMAKNWISVVLLIWAAVATLLLFFKTQDSNISDTRSTECGVDSDKMVEAKKVSSTIQEPVKSLKLSPDDHKQSIIHQQLSEHQPHLARYVSKVFRQESVYGNENFTMILLTYKRTKVLPKLLLHYCKVKHLHKILVIWNDVDTQIPQDILALANKCEVTLQFIQEKENKLTNRFKPRPEIETECK